MSVGERRAGTLILREPLLHFVVLGALLFGLDALTHRNEGRDDAERDVGSAGEAEGSLTRELSIGDGVRRSLSDDFLHEEGRVPTPSELEERIARWTDEEILYREGIARELDEHDERVRTRVATLMADVLRAELFVPEPTEAELRAYFDTNAERWAEPERVDFVHVFIDAATEGADERAQGFLTSLEAGASPARMGDTFTGGRHYRGRRIEDLREAFGGTFADDVASAPIDRWTLMRSRFGLHVVRIEQRSAGSDADFERARLDVARALDEARQTEAMERALATLRARWTIRASDGE